MNAAYCRLAVVLAASFLFAASCNRKNEVEVSFPNSETAIDQQQNIRFMFSKAVCPDSLLMCWDSTEYVQFRPSVRGLFKWASSSELQFSPSEEFLPGTEYEATVNSSALERAGIDFDLGKRRSFRFHTAPLQVSGTHLWYTRGPSGEVVTQLDIDFNYEVRISVAVSKLRLSSQGHVVSFNSVSGGVGRTVSLQFQPLTGMDEATPLNISLDKGIPLAAGKYVSKNDTQLKAEIPSLCTLSITGISSGHSGAEGYIIVNTSQPVPEEGLNNFLTVEPSVKFEVSVSDAGFSLSSPEFMPEQTYQLSINPALEGVLGGKMKKSFSGQVNFGRPEPSIRFVSTKGMCLSPRG